MQHLESLHDVIARITGVRKSEVLAASVLERAREIELTAGVRFGVTPC